jgi:hypothetical protein
MRRAAYGAVDWEEIEGRPGPTSERLGCVAGAALAGAVLAGAVAALSFLSLCLPHAGRGAADALPLAGWAAVACLFVALSTGFASFLTHASERTARRQPRPGCRRARAK